MPKGFTFKDPAGNLSIAPADYMVARSLADRLMATCEPNAYWDELDALTQPQALALDTIAFECCTCNHWHPIAEQVDTEGRYYCKDCAP